MARKFTRTRNKADRKGGEGLEGQIRAEQGRENARARNGKGVWRERNSVARGYLMRSATTLRYVDILCVGAMRREVQVKSKAGTAGR